MTAQEHWAPIPDYEGRYEVSSMGRVRSLGFYSGNRFKTRTWRAGRVLKPATIHGSGYQAVNLSDGAGGLRWHRVHRLVLAAFVGGPPPGKPNSLHKDDDPANNALSNLRWGTRSENSEDSVRNGNHTQSRKTVGDCGHLLREPNLVASSIAVGNRSCLACKLAAVNHLHDARLLAREGRGRTRYNHGRDGFLRRADESKEDEANRRYLHIMNSQDTL